MFREINRKPYCLGRAFRVSLLFLLPFFWAQNVWSQCTGCTTVVATSTGASYTVNAGVTMCINAGVTFSGNITLNGGTVCNSGTVTNITFLKGTFNNYKLFRRSTTISAAINGNCTINNYAGATFSVTGGLNLATTTATNQLYINIERGSSYVTTGSSNTNGVLKMDVGVNGTSTLNPVCNVNGNFSASNAGFILTVEQGCTFNVTGTTALNNKLSKTITNRGTINFGNSLSVGGDGVNTGTVTITNTGQMICSSFVTASFLNGPVNIINDSLISVNGALTFGNANHIFTNNKTLTLSTDMIATTGTVMNTGTITARDIDIRQASFTNNKFVNALRSVLTNSTSGVITNNGYIYATYNFTNKGRLNLGEASLIYSKNYYNTVTTATVNGPSGSIADTNYYAKIVVRDTSQNGSYLNGKVIIHDQTLLSQTANGNINYGFDVVANPSRIAGTVLFASKAVAPGNGNPAVISCPIKKNIYSAGVQFNPNVTSINCGQSITMTAQLQIMAYDPLTSSFYPVIVTPAGLNFSWLPSASFTNPNLQVQTISPLVTTNYTASVNYLGCIYKKLFTLTVVPPFSANITSSGVAICNNTNVNLTANVTPSGSYSYLWYKGGNVTGITASVYSAVSPDTYQVLVTNSSSGCQGWSNSISLQASPTPLVVNAGPDQIYNGTAVTIGDLNNCASGGTLPYSINWAPTTGFVGGGATQCVNQVAPTTQITYVLTVTDFLGCTATDNVTVIMASSLQGYIVPKKQIDGGYQITQNNSVYFQFEEEYRGSSLSYKIYDYNSGTQNAVPGSVVCSNLTGALKSLGDNRYAISLATCAPALTVSKYYLVELTNDKNEKFYFKFLR